MKYAYLDHKYKMCKRAFINDLTTCVGEMMALQNRGYLIKLMIKERGGVKII